MKEATDLYLIDSEHQNFQNPEIGQNFFEQEKVGFNFEQAQGKGMQQQSEPKTPKQRRGRKSSIKNNPDDNSASKMLKIKDKKYKGMLGDKQKNFNQLFGHWSVEENKKYHWFLQIYHSHFMNRSLRRMDRIFTSMAKFVGTREAQQCRSHHQKMEKKHKNFTKILLSLRTSHYGNQAELYLKEDIDQNQLDIVESLLTQQFLIHHVTLKRTMNQFENQKQERKQIHQQKLDFKQDEDIISIKEVEVDIIEQIMAPELESSNNFKHLSQNQERINILDDGYESNLPFTGFF